MRYFLLVILLLCLQSCCSSHIPTYVAKSDTCFITQNHVDSIYLHDSIMVNTYRDSDTIIKVVTNHRHHYHYRNIVDTIYKVKCDTIRINYAHNRHTLQDDPKRSSLSLTSFFVTFLIIIIIIVYVRFSSRSRR